jgi:putative PIN family toxin of toxin-antitoxin system
VSRGREVPLVVVDTNLLVALLFDPRARAPAALLAEWKQWRLRFCVSPAVVREIEATFRRLPVPEPRKREVLALLEDPVRTERIDAIEDTGFRCADPADDKFLHLAVAAKADALLTSDRALLQVEDLPVPVLKAGQWLKSRKP